MAKFLDKTIDEWDEIVEQWHNDESIEMPLIEYMGLDEVEYLKYVHNITDPNVSEEEVFEITGKQAREAVVGLTIMEMLDGIKEEFEDDEISF